MSCSICSKSVRISADMLSCADCEANFHIVCVKMTKEDAEFIKKNKQMWRCSSCSSTRRKSMALESTVVEGEVSLQDIAVILKKISEKQDSMESKITKMEKDLGNSIDSCHEAIQDLTIIIIIVNHLVTAFKRECEEYSKIVKDNDCTQFNPDKPWDYEVKSGEFPHLVLLNVEGDDTLFCAGSLISDNFVLTATFCAIKLERKGNGTFWVRLGENSLQPSTKKALRLKVIKSYNHPQYDDKKKENLISLLELEKSVQFDEMKRPACLNTNKEIAEPVFVSGWGITDNVRSNKSGRPSTLLKTVLEVSKQREKPLNLDPESPLFILTKSKPGKKDACIGDGGAPVMTNLKDLPCMYNIVGIVAYGGKCAVHQTASTRVSNYIEWIESIVWPGEL